jgi:outer membrane protein TolC
MGVCALDREVRARPKSGQRNAGEVFMKNIWNVERIVALCGVLVTLTLVATPCLALNRDEARQVSDSLSSVYASGGEELVFDAVSAGLADYLAYAAHQSPEVRAAFYQWKGAMERAGYVGAMPDPVLAYTYFIERVETRVGPQIQRVALKQAFPWFGTLGARKDVAWEEANAAYQRLQSEMLKLFYQVRRAYYDYYYLGREVAITGENLQLLEFWESVARAKYRVGLTQHPDIIKAQLELGKLEDQLRTLEDRIAPVATKLRAVMDLPDSVALPLPDSIEVAEVGIEPDTVLAWALANNPDLKSLGHAIDRGRAERNLASKTSLPSFQLALDYIDVGSAVVPNVPDSGKDTWMASVQLSLPIWFGANKARKQEADARLLKARYDHTDAQNRLRALVEAVTFGHEDALRKTRLYRDGLLPKAEQSLNANYVAYQAGELSFLNVLDAQRLLLELQLQFERARSDLAIHRAEIEMITGRDQSLWDVGGDER